MSSTRIQPGTLQRQVMDNEPKADKFDMVGFGNNFKGLTYTTGTRQWWWAAADGTTAPEAQQTRADASDALIEYDRAHPATPPPGPTYTTEKTPDADEWCVVRRRVDRADTLVAYSDQGSADLVTQLLTSLARYEA